MKKRILLIAGLAISLSVSGLTYAATVVEDEYGMEEEIAADEEGALEEAAVVEEENVVVEEDAGEADNASYSEAVINVENVAEPEPVVEIQGVSETPEYEYEDVFADWNDGAPALDVLVDYVEAVTDEASPDFIPEADRIAVFDMDGTLYGELFPTYLEYYMLAWRILKDPNIEPDAEMLALGRELRESVISNSFAEDMPIRHALQAARAYAGMTLNEFSDFVTDILLRDVDGFEGMTYGEAFYLPMLEVIEYLNDYGFKTYVCSGSDRFICRTLFEGIVDVPDEQIIGMDVELDATGQDGEDGLDYVFSLSDDVVRTDRLLIKNLKMNKVRQIAQEIGRQPVLSFGNSSGDVSMHNFVLSNKNYRSAAFMLIADDEERDYGNAQKGEELRAKWEDSGFTVISMRDDFRTIYGDDVVKTGSFRWAEELEDDRTDPEEETEATPEEAPAAEEAPEEAPAPEAEEMEGAEEESSEVTEEAAEENAAQAVEPLEDKPLYVTVRRLNVRAGASTGDEIVGSLYQGDEVQPLETVTDDTGNDWVRISYQGAEAYVSGAFLSEEAPAA